MAVSVTVAVAVAVGVRVAVAVTVAVAVGVAVAVWVAVLVTVALTVGVAVAVEVRVAVEVAVAVKLAAAVTLGVGVDVGGGSVDGVAVGVRVGVRVAVMVGFAVATLPGRFLILIRCGANTVVPPCSSSAVRSYSPGATAPMLSVVTEDAWVGWKESESTFDPFCFRTSSRNIYCASEVPDDDRTVAAIWTICAWPGLSIPLEG